MDDIVKRLREASKVKYGIRVNVERELLTQAADAIEELIKKLNHADDQIERLVNAAEDRRWIPVAERLPEEDTDVLCWYEYYHWSAKKVLPEYGIGHYWNGRWGGEISNGRECKVLAWMPLPEPPKEVNTDEGN